ncbi:uncharacterized protein MELLADRAFT_61169 [Melampsora larici-populina 98AG31]|uniref:Uncharacterized protein n=1 Tax=Melampsora larici-populina (strain 98AG31 / pathotype 3-4-7) TaxID=747676 RepID=F4RDV4_MELLP|nr:uncharacterized protein MELLADRAFT_61169 [Melampsora larici-populina 98AG31]EGG09467.1 hypothetical protein MELLADRAFT_61169 [Melampsora larici-populina 98AG31]
MFFRKAASANPAAQSNTVSTNQINGSPSTREDSFSVTYDRCLGISLIGAEQVFRAQGALNKSIKSTTPSVAPSTNTEKSVVIDVASPPKRSNTLKWGRSKANPPSNV